MASSPLSGRQEAPDRTTDLCWKALAAMDAKLMRGESFSGHERNCLYLNLGEWGSSEKHSPTAPWAAASFVSGFDFDDDARALAITDWDSDGDLDLWLSNRTAPKVRFLRNDMPKAGPSITLRLIATRGHASAIGARVSLTLKHQPGQPLVREVRAGEGFLTQSSRLLHFGLGPQGASAIDTITVRWPGGAEESFAPAPQPGSFRVTEGTGRLEPLPQRKTAPLDPEPFTIPDQSFPASVRLAVPVPLPPLAYTDAEQKAHRLDTVIGGTRLAVLWSPDSDEATAQLTAIDHLRSALAPSRVTLLALADAEGAAAHQPLTAHPQLKGGGLSPVMLGRLERLGRACFEIHLPLAPGQAWLIDRQGALIAWYRTLPTSLEVQQALPLTDLMRSTAIEQHLPFKGTWQRPSFHFQPLELATYMRDEQTDPLAAAEYLLTNQTDFRTSKRFGGACLKTAEALENKNDPALKEKALSLRRLVAPGP